MPTRPILPAWNPDLADIPGAKLFITTAADRAPKRGTPATSSTAGKGRRTVRLQREVGHVALEVAMTAGYPPYATPRSSSRRTGAFSRDSVLWRLDWVLILRRRWRCASSASLLVYSATRVKLADAGLDPMSELKRHILNIAIGVCLAAS